MTVDDLYKELCGHGCGVDIGNIGNYYGDLRVRRTDAGYEWGIGDVEGDHWDKIPESLALELLKFEKAFQDACASQPAQPQGQH